MDVKEIHDGGKPQDEVGWVRHKHVARVRQATAHVVVRRLDARSVVGHFLVAGQRPVGSWERSVALRGSEG